MDEFVYNALSRYFHALEVSGYMNEKNIDSLLILIFYYHLIADDLNGYIDEKDYRTIEKALNCLYGSNCLIPYPDYLSMKGSFVGVSSKVYTMINEYMEGYESFNAMLQQHEERITATENTKVVKAKEYIRDIAEIDIPE